LRVNTFGLPKCNDIPILLGILYSFFANKKKVEEERKKMPTSKIIESITKTEFPPNQLFIILELIANDLDTDEEVEIPYVKFRFR